MEQYGWFISFEGTEGVGKTTAIKALCSFLDKEKIEYIKTREPGGSSFAETLRNILLDTRTKVNDDTELLLVFAGRCDHIHNTILPALQAGKWVICDRFFDSTVAYQGFARGHGSEETLNKIQSLIDQFVHIKPDLTLWLDMPVEEGMRRAGKRSAADRFEQEEASFFTRVYEGFQSQAEKNPDRIKRIEALGTSDEVGIRVCEAVQSKFNINTARQKP